MAAIRFTLLTYIIVHLCWFQLSKDDECYEFKQQIVYRIHPYYVEYYWKSLSAFDVTLVTHLSADQLQMLELLCNHWPGPISLALYMTDAEAYQFAEYVMENPVLTSRRNIAYHVVYKNGVCFWPNVATELQCSAIVMTCCLSSVVCEASVL